MAVHKGEHSNRNERYGSVVREDVGEVQGAWCGLVPTPLLMLSIMAWVVWSSRDFVIDVATKLKTLYWLSGLIRSQLK